MIRVSVLLCVLSLSACSRSHEHDTLELRDPSNAREHAGAGTGAATDPQSSAQTSTGDDSAGDSGLGQASDHAPAPIAAAGEDASEVWIGQLWSPTSDTWLCLPDRSASDERHTPSSAGNTQRVVLLLESVGSDGLGGRIRLGTGAPPDGSPTDYDYESSTNYTSCSFTFPTAGVEYPLFDVDRSSERLTFSIAPLQVWNGWCATQSMPASCSRCSQDQNICECTDGACKGATNSRLVFDLAITSDTIEGEILRLGELRLTRRAR